MTSERGSRSLIPYSVNATKIAKYSLEITATPCRPTVAGGIISIRPTYSCARCPCTYLITYLHKITSVLATGLWSSFLDFSANDLSSVPLPLAGPKIMDVVVGLLCAWIVLRPTAASRGLRCYCTPLVIESYIPRSVSGEIWMLTDNPESWMNPDLTHHIYIRPNF